MTYCPNGQDKVRLAEISNVSNSMGSDKLESERKWTNDRYREDCCRGYIAV